MEEWKEYRIEDTSIKIIDGDRGVNYPKGSDFYPTGYCLFLNAGNVTKQGFSFTENSFITQEKDNKLRNGRLERNDVVITTRGTVGNVALYDSLIPYDHIRINSGMLILKSGKDILPEYLFYYLKSDSFQRQISQYVSGSAQPQLPKSTLSKMSITFPNSLKTQKRIADILKSLDNKIELNNRINHNLEELLFTIYSDMLPRCIGQQTIGNIASNVFSGGTPDTKQPSFWGGHINWLSSGETSDHFIIGTNKFITSLGLQESSTKYASKYDVVIASAGQGNTRGQTSLLLLNTCINQSVIAIHADAGHSFIIYCSLSNRYNELRAISDTSSIRGSLTTKMISAMEIPVFSQADQDMFTSKASSIISLIELNLRENYSLNKIRDIILPKMMTGQLSGLLHY